MRELENGSTLYIRRKGIGFTVEHISAAGMLADSIDCDNLAEARAALAFGPDRW